MERTPASRQIRLAAAFAVLTFSAQGQAQDLGSAAPSKSEAILGAPSQLAAIMAAQSGSSAATLSLSRASFTPQRAPFFTAAPAPPPAPAPEAADLGASPTRPDIFNSVAMPVAHTALDSRWSRVGTASVGGRAARFALALRGRDERSRLEAVNAYVNARIAFTNDRRQFGVDDRWSSANDTLARGRGDCEDFALAKLAMLRRAGFADQDLYFVVLKDLGRRADHAVLVVRSGGRFLVLDNGTNRLADSALISDYRPVLTFTAGQRFVHGYRRSATPPLVLASYDARSGQPRISLSDRSGMPSSPFASR